MKFKELFEDEIFKKYYDLVKYPQDYYTKRSIDIFQNTNSTSKFLNTLNDLDEEIREQYINVLSECEVNKINYSCTISKYSNSRNVEYFCIYVDTEPILKDGMLIYEDTLLECFDCGKEYRFPDNVTKIRNGVRFPEDIEIIDFNNVNVITNKLCKDCKKLKRIILDNATSIWGNAFQNCLSLSDVFIPDSVNHIAYAAFFVSGDVAFPKERRISVSKETKFHESAFAHGSYCSAYKPTNGVVFRESVKSLEQELEDLIKTNRDKEQKLRNKINNAHK